MKANNNDRKRILVWLLVIILGVAIAGCSDDEETAGIDDGPLDIASIILNPKSAQPGDTVQATVIVSGESAHGSYPSVAWQSVGGTFLDNAQYSVSWVAPTTGGVYTLSCTVTNSVGSVSASANIFVGEPRVIVADEAGEIQVIPSGGGNFYYLHSPLIWDGDSSYVYLYDGTSSEVIPGAPNGVQFDFYLTDVTARVAHAQSGIQVAINTEDPINIWLLDLDAQTQLKLTSDMSLPGGLRHQQYQYPSFSPDGNVITFQGFLPSSDDENPIDTLDIFVYDIATGTTIDVNKADTLDSRRRNMYPTFSTDYNWLLFVSDREERASWDLYALPVNNGVVDTLMTSVHRFTSNAIAGVGSWGSIRQPKMAWNPPNPSLSVLAIASADGILRFIQTSLSGPTITSFPALAGTIRELLWAGDASTLAVSVVPTGTGVNSIYTINFGQEPVLRHEALAGDQIVDMAWSPNQQFMVYRVVRAGLSWFELLDIDGGSGFSEPVVITATRSMGSRFAYAEMMTTNACYVEGDSVYVLEFDGDTPEISVVSVAGVLQ